MINGNLEQFLDLGWCTESTLFYNGYIYWCEGYENSNTGLKHFFVDRWKAENEDNLYYHSVLEPDNTIKSERVYENTGDDFDLIKKDFLESGIFEGKTFWEIEKEIAWLDDGGDINL